MNDGGLPDGVSSLDLPGNSHADELREIYVTIHRPYIERRARADLCVLCAIPGAIRNGYLEYVAKHGITPIPEYVRALQNMNAAVWARTFDLIVREQFEPMEAA